MSSQKDNNHVYDELWNSANNLLSEENETVNVKFFMKDKSAKLFLFTNHKYSLLIRVINLLVKMLPCILYFVQVINDDPRSTFGCCHICKNHSLNHHISEESDISVVHWERLIFVNRTKKIWIAQIISATLSMLQFIISLCLTPKFHLSRIKVLWHGLLEVLCSALFWISILYSHKLRCLFIPSFLTCWLAKSQFEGTLSDLNKVFPKQSLEFFHKILKVVSTTCCIMLTSICSFQHLQRAGYRHFSLFESLWFVVITFTTVGYGDYKPDIWPSQLFMIVIIIISLIIMPVLLQRLVCEWLEQNKLGGTYNLYRAKEVKHVVICTNCLEPEVIVDSLNEFYSNELTKNYLLCILSTCQLNNSTKKLINAPVWKQRVVYIQGSPLLDSDLLRCRMQNAEACFIFVCKTDKDFHDADQNVIMQSWAIKDFAPNCRQFIQLYKPENKIHVNFAENVLCIDDFKYALLGNNILIPGISTLVTLLTHTTKGEEGQTSNEEWQKIYGKCSGNEIYHSKLKESKFFNKYSGQSFQNTSYKVYKKYGIMMVGVCSPDTYNIQLNPASKHIMKNEDICYYLSLSEEAKASVITRKKPIINDDINTVNCNGNNENQRNIEQHLKEDSSELQSFESKLIVGCPHILPCIESASSLCYLLDPKRKMCCLKLLNTCIHRENNALDNCLNKNVLVCAESASYGLYHFIIPLRNTWIQKDKLKPLILLLKKEPDIYFLDFISQFPLVYWLLGSPDRLEDLLKARITFADQIVISNNQVGKIEDKNTYADFTTVLCVQKLNHLFPHLKIITALSERNNMRFTLFSAEDKYALSMSKIEKKEIIRGSHVSYIFRLPFAAGQVFSTHMLNTILFQTYAKPYLLRFMRLLLGIDSISGSGHLESYHVQEADLKFQSYGEFYRKVILSTSQIPIGIYRTIQREKNSTNNNREDGTLKMENHKKEDVIEMIRNKLSNLGLSYSYEGTEDSQYYYTSFVIINPQYEFQMQKDDIIYLISPSLETNSFPPSASYWIDKPYYQSTSFNSQSPMSDNSRSEFFGDYRHDNSPLLREKSTAALV